MQIRVSVLRSRSVFEESYLRNCIHNLCGHFIGNDINTKYKSHFAQLLYYCIQSAQPVHCVRGVLWIYSNWTEPLLLLSLFLLFVPLGAVSQIVNYNNRTLRKGCWINTNRWICPWTDDDDATSMMIIIKTLYNGPPAKYFLIFLSIHSFTNIL